MTILLIEDDQQYKSAIMRVLKKYNFLTMSSGIGVLPMLEIHSIDLIITDIMMPDQEGIETILSIRENTDYDNIPIIAISSNVTYLKLAQDIGADYIIEKPFPNDALHNIVDYYLSH